MFTKKDLFSSTFTGFYTGFIVWRVLVFLEVYIYPFGAMGTPYTGCNGTVCTTTIYPHYISWSVLMFIIPILWIIGVNFGYFLGRWVPFFNQFGRFAAIGFTNAAVDFGVLNVLIAWSGVASGILYAVFKTISFVISVTHSYYWNRHWVFESQSDDKSKEFFKFISVYIIAAAVNVGVSYGVVSFINPMFGVSPNVWANLGAVVGSAISLAFSFIGVRSVVFKKKDNVIP